MIVNIAIALFTIFVSIFADEWVVRILLAANAVWLLLERWSFRNHVTALDSVIETYRSVTQTYRDLLRDKDTLIRCMKARN